MWFPDFFSELTQKLMTDWMTGAREMLNPFDKGAFFVRRQCLSMKVSLATCLTTLRVAIQSLPRCSSGYGCLINIGIGPICKASKCFCKGLVSYGLGSGFFGRHGTVDVSFDGMCHSPY